ncbi:MAG: type II secretion system F family protein [Acidimicrobiales bacterium]
MIGVGLTMGALLAGAGALAPRRGRIPVGADDAWIRVERRVHQRLVAADLPVAVDRPLVWWFGAVPVAAGIGVVAGSWPVAAVVSILVGVVPPMVVLARGDRSDAMLTRQLPALVDAVARQFRVGRSLPQAFDELRNEVGPPLDGDLHEIVGRVARGRPIPGELVRWTRSRRSVDLQVVATALAIGHSAGGQRAGVLEAVGRSLRDQQSVAAELEALTAQARASALVVALAPPGFAVLLSVTGASASWSEPTPVLVAVVAAGVILDLVGWWWMRRLTRLEW